jgi:hypothetical protein
MFTEYQNTAEVYEKWVILLTPWYRDLLEKLTGL